MKITKDQFKGIVREVMIDESEYQTFFAKALEKTGKSISEMSEEEKKAFFNKIDAAWDAKGEKNEELAGNQHKLDVDGDGEIEASDLAALRAGKTNEATTSSMPGSWVGYVNTLKGKKLMGVFKSATGAKSWLTKNQDNLLNKKDVENVGIMNKKQWDEREAKYAIESVNEAKYPTNLYVNSIIYGQGFTGLKGIEGGKYYKVVEMDDTTATLAPCDQKGKITGSTKVRHKLSSLEGGIKTAKRGDENGIVVESVNEVFSDNKNLNNIMKGRKITNVAYDSNLGFAVILDNGKYIQFDAHSARPGQSKDMTFESVNEDYDGPAILKTGDKNALKVGEKITINSGGKKKEYKVVKSNGNGDFVLHLVEGVNESLTANDGKILLNGKPVGYYDYDRGSAAFWTTDLSDTQFRGSKAFDTKEEMLKFFKKYLSRAAKALEYKRKALAKFGIKYPADESVNEASNPTIKVVNKLKNEEGIQIVVVKTTKGETMYGGFVVRGKLQKVIPAGANNSKEGVQKRALQIWDEFGKQLGESMNEEIKVGQMVKVDNPHWEAALGKKGPFSRKVKMIDHDNVFFTDGSNSSMKYIKK
jgi:hypothetical protein